LATVPAEGGLRRIEAKRDRFHHLPFQITERGNHRYAAEREEADAEDDGGIHEGPA
jgi:hypothetical protein